ncbi:MAG TPA: hypothetical protein VH619_17520 [Verrucomicrobiae bacterium]|jgi:hypothetical protein|nr:hypothetical protein [Verrucomicrobiae bacterium]
MQVSARNRLFAIGVFIFLLFVCQPTLRANVYATDIRINGSLVGGVILPGGQVTISYILNDNATAGVSLKVTSSTNVIWTNSFPGGSAGTLVGLNSVVWDGTNNTGTNISPGGYTVSITAASTGYDSWTNITDDGTNFRDYNPTGVDINRNTNSPYYGRVFIGCTVGEFTIFKYNADGSPGDEGASNPGGSFPTNLTWGAGTGLANQDFSPWKISVAANDKVYINDFSGDGFVYALDETLTNYVEALRMDNYPTNDLNPWLSGLQVTGTGTNAFIWMSDEQVSMPAGIIRWQLTADGTVATNDPGEEVAPIGTNTALTTRPFDIAVDTNGILYAIQFFSIQFFQTNPPPLPPAILSFAPYEGAPETNALWEAGAGETNLVQAYGIAVDPSATYVAVAVQGGNSDPEGGISGMLDLYYATNGNYFTNLDQTGGDQYSDVAWDNVGNLYALDTYSSNLNASVWRIYSPPGSNQATTVAVPIIRAYNSLAPALLTNPSLGSNGICFTLQGQPEVTYWVEQSPDLMNWTPVTTNFSGCANRPIMIPYADNQDFYRAIATP